MSGWSTLMRQATALSLLLVVALALVLLTVAHRVQTLEEELGTLRQSVATEKQRIHVLKAEFSYLAEPERLRRLSSRYLGLVPVSPQQMATLATLDDALRDNGGPLLAKASSKGGVMHANASRMRTR